jgi:hypothetical protein
MENPAHELEATVSSENTAIFDLLPPIFRDCVSDYTGRKYCLEYPQQVGDHVYATDGRILVRMLSTPRIAEALPSIVLPKPFPESVATMIGPREKWHAEPTALPSLDHLKRCVACEGAAYLPDHPCSCATYDDGEAPCHGKGIIPAGPCWDCDGTGIGEARAQFIPLRDDVRLSAYFLWVLRKHGVTLFLPVAINTHSETTPAYFTLGAVEGVVMPKRVEEEKVQPQREVAPA